MKGKMIAAFAFVLFVWVMLSRQEDVIWPAWIFPLIFPLMIYILHKVYHRCPECRKFDALELQTTAAEMKMDPSTMHRYRCQYCQEITYKFPGYV